MGKMGQDEFIKRCCLKHNNLYDYSKTVYKTTRDRITVTCPVHGDFIVLADNHLRTSGCPKCGTVRGARSTTISFPQFKERLSKLDLAHIVFEEKEYVNSRTPISVFCTRHQYMFYQKPYDIYKGRTGCKFCLSDKISLKARSTTSRFIESCRDVYGDIYNYRYTKYTTNTNNVIISCNIHGEFSKSPKTFLRGSHCPKCMKSNLNDKHEQNFISNFHQNWSNYTLMSKYRGNFTPVDVKCKLHGMFNITPEQCRVRIDICDGCAAVNGSKPELKIIEILDEYGIDYKRHYKLVTENGTFELDVYIPLYNLAIEVNGLYWHRERENGTYSKIYHVRKTNECQQRGIKLLHFYDTEINDKYNIVRSIILNNLKHNTDKVYGRNTVVRYITRDVKKEFLNNYHLQGNDRSSVYLGLFYNDILVSVMTFGTRQITGSVDHELMRYCVKSNMNILGGFSKLLKFYITNHKVSKIKTYADRRHSDGNIYRKNNFKFLRYSTPSYWYFNTREYKLYHRYNFAKHLLKHKMLHYDASKSERQIMKENNYFRVWDCGHCVFELDIIN